MRKKQAGFSLVELMIVLVIIGILAAVGVPIYTSNMNKARQAEADATLGTIRTDLRVYYAENEAYPATGDGSVAGAAWNNIQASDITGKYFAAADYTYEQGADDQHFTLTCAKGTILDADRTLNEAGVFAGGMD